MGVNDECASVRDFLLVSSKRFSDPWHYLDLKLLKLKALQLSLPLRMHLCKFLYCINTYKIDWAGKARPIISFVYYV
jgi:hypothetical protein